LMPILGCIFGLLISSCD
ncbi:hypothetical protein, partial [Plasmodium yoelii yoelii]